MKKIKTAIIGLIVIALVAVLFSVSGFGFNGSVRFSDTKYHLIILYGVEKKPENRYQNIERKIK